MNLTNRLLEISTRLKNYSTGHGNDFTFLSRIGDDFHLIITLRLMIYIIIVIMYMYIQIGNQICHFTL